MDDRKTNGLRQFEITGAPFTGDPTKWDDIKGAVCTTATANNVSFLIENGMHLFKCRQELNADPDNSQAQAYYKTKTQAQVAYLSMRHAKGDPRSSGYEDLGEPANRQEAERRQRQSAREGGTRALHRLR